MIGTYSLHRRLLSCAFIVAVCLILLCGVSTFADTFLYGGVQHSDTLPVLPNNLKSGRPIAEMQAAVSQQGQKYYWYQVAPWMAGTWQTETVALSERVPMNKPNTPMNKDHEFLQQIDLAVVKDDQGQFWNCQSIPRYTGPVRQGAFDSFELTRSVQALTAESLKSHVIELVTNPTTDLIEQVNQEEHLNVYQQGPKGRLHIEQSQVFYDAQGKPVEHRKALIIAHRVGPFKQTSDLSIFASFVAFIKERRAQTVNP